MRIPFTVKNKINKTKLTYAPRDWASRSDWIADMEGNMQTEDGRYRIVSDQRLGLVIAQVKNRG